MNQINGKMKNKKHLLTRWASEQRNYDFHGTGHDAISE